MHILDEMEARGLVQDVTHPEELRARMDEGPVPFYTGYDPTAPSLHLGSLLQIATQARLQRAGHKPIALVGGATGMIGDPSGKSEERALQDADTLAANVAGLRAQLARFLDFSDGPTGAVVVNNHDWLGPVGYLEFLRDVGKHLTINYMMAKESVRARLEDREQGISYTEFSYMLLQAWDFVHLARTHGCELQVGGSDQWGNITAGIELGRKLDGASLYGLVTPLLLDASGQKMGKTAAGTKVWLDPDRTSPYAFYQHLLNVDDADVGKLLRIFSWRPVDELEDLIARHEQAPPRREAQKTLAEDVTAWVHGDEALRRAKAASEVMFGGSLEALSDADLEPLLADVPSSDLPKDELAGGVGLVDLLARTELTKSKGAARRLVQQGGVYVNNERETDPEATLTTERLGTESMLVLRAGKKSYHIVRVR
ncbi:MAG TPA: tyrosine--tRNA ligase [Sandaracinaceae bacterium LLY-WYZ-13_1]|nr:tyrosine--tRNA ligase [Sandaracinaceae bacterium LLY-WYZ-13_1]